MKYALWIVSLLTFVVLGAAIVGQALVVMFGVEYRPDGIPLDPTPQALVAGTLSGFGGLLAMPLVVATFTLALVATAQARRYGWLMAMVVVGLLACVGLAGMAWVLLSSSSPVALVTPLVAIPVITVLFSCFSAPSRTTPSAARR